MIWDSDQYWKKAVRYVELAAHLERETWGRPFWLSLALEFLARASLTKVHPALNADPQGDGLNLLYAFGFTLTGQPKSLPIHAVLLRLQKIIPETFTEPRRAFCDFFSNERNRELHTCELPFDTLQESKWLARFYDVCQVLCAHLGKDLTALFDAEESRTAKDLIGALQSEKLSTVKRKIAAHRTIFEEKSQEERKKLQEQTATLAQAWRGSTTKAVCPSCGCSAQLKGSAEKESPPYYDGIEFQVRTVVLANRLSCDGCGLVLLDIDELHLAEIEPHFEYFSSVNLHDYHDPDQGAEYDNM